MESTNSVVRLKKLLLFSTMVKTAKKVAPKVVKKTRKGKQTFNS